MLKPATTKNIYQHYTYSYPHKHSYRPLPKPISLQAAWQAEDQSNLFAYLHIPFCEMRCGFCNLFTIANPKSGVGNYLAALQREAITYKILLPNIQFETYAIGGGTPTFLSELELEKMLSIFKNDLGVDTQNKYGSIEASPKSLTSAKIKIIENYGIDRISMGIQSWIESETKNLGRPQSIDSVKQAIKLIKASSIPEFNLDLIYGIYGQTEQSWLYSLEQAIRYEPTEIFLYPLYTRPLTGLQKMQQSTEDQRLLFYRIGREYLKSNGYIQTSMRCFRKVDAPVIHSNYSATKDGMIGIGAGARSYTKDLHYSTNYAVSRKATQAIIHAYSEKEYFDQIDYGIFLQQDERMRRFFIKSLIDGGRLDVNAFVEQFNISPTSIPLIDKMIADKWLIEKDHYLQLSEQGMEMEDTIGPALFSEDVKDLMRNFELT